MCFGTFDVLHLGHLDYFQQAKQHADKLVVVVARDKTKTDQQKETIFDEQERLKLVKSLQIVDEATLGHHDNHFKIIEEKKPDIILLGYDHPITEKQLSEKLLPLHLYPKVLRAKPYKPHKHKSTKIKELLLQQQ